MARSSSRPSRIYPSKVDAWIQGVMVSAPSTALFRSNDAHAFLKDIASRGYGK